MRINYISNKLLFLAKGLFMMLFILAIITSCSDDGTIAPDPEEEPELEPEPLEVVEFASEALKVVIVKEYDTNNDSEIDLDEAEKVTEINVDGITEITTMEDIANFANLQTLICSSTGITSLDITKNEVLKYLDASDTNIGNGTRAAELCLDTSNNPLLEYLDLHNTNVKVLDLSNNPVLSVLLLSSTLIEELDLSSNPLLEVLNIRGTPISGIDLSNNTALTELDASGSELETIDISNNELLEILNLSGTNITKISLTDNTALRELDMSYTAITSLDISECTALESLNVSGTKLWTLDVSDCPYLATLDVDDCDRLNSILYDGTTQDDYSWITSIIGIFMDDITIPNYNTDNPDKATIYLSAEWTTLHDGDTAPTEYTILNNGTEQRVSAETIYLLDPSASGDFLVYNLPSGITISDGVATLSEATRAATDPEPNPEHLYYGVGSATLIADQEQDIKVTTSRATAPLTLQLSYVQSEVMNIAKAVVELSGIITAKNLWTGESEYNDTLTQYPTISDTSSELEITYNIMGVDDSGSQILTITYTTIDDKTIIVTSDITSQLASFNDDMEPVTLAGDMNLPTDLDGVGSITDWDNVEAGDGTAR